MGIQQTLQEIQEHLENYAGNDDDDFDTQEWDDTQYNAYDDALFMEDADYVDFHEKDELWSKMVL